MFEVTLGTAYIALIQTAYVLVAIGIVAVVLFTASAASDLFSFMFKNNKGESDVSREESQQLPSKPNGMVH